MTSKTRNGGDTGILLDAGTNEAEILVFKVGREKFGVNVAKVREVLPVEEVTALPESHGAVDGVVRIRKSVVPLVNLETFLDRLDVDGMGDEPLVNSTMLLLEFNQEQIAFRVHGVDRIHRVSWRNTVPLPQVTGMTAPVTSVILLDGQLVPLLDFETIAAVVGVSGNAGVELHLSDDQLADHRNQPIVFAEDSHLIAEMLRRALNEAGYTQVHGFADGEDAWHYLNSLSENCAREDLSRHVAAVISDIEMPRMDGFSLTRQIRENAVLADLPVLLFSSLVSAANEKKGRQVGASAQVPKPDYGQLLSTLEELIAAKPEPALV